MLRKEVEKINAISDATRFSLGRKVLGNSVLLGQPVGLQVTEHQILSIPCLHPVLNVKLPPPHHVLAPAHCNKNRKDLGWGKPGSWWAS